MGYGHGPYGHGPYGHATVGTTGYTVAALLAQMGIDDVSSVAVSDSFLLILRDPQPDEDGIPRDTRVRLRIVALDTDPTVLGEGIARFDVWLYGRASTPLFGALFSYNAPVGTFPHADWQGAANGFFTHNVGDPYCYLDVTVDHDPNTFASEEIVAVFVKALDTIGNSTSAGWGAYEFQVEDTTPPSIVGAEARDQFTVRVAFDDNMALDGPGSALNAAAYTFTRENVDPEPAVNLTATAVEAVANTVASKAEVKSGFGPWDFSAWAQLYVSAIVDGVQYDGILNTFLLANPAVVEAFEIAALLRVGAMIGGWGIGARRVLDDSVNPPQYRVGVYSLTDGADGSVEFVPAVLGTPDLAQVMGFPTGQVAGTNQQFDISTQWEQTPDAPYRITVDGTVTDESGNGVA